MGEETKKVVLPKVFTLAHPGWRVDRTGHFRWGLDGAHKPLDMGIHLNMYPDHALGPLEPPSN